MISKSKRASTFLTENVRYWHKADMLNALTDVRFWKANRTLTNRCLPISIYEYTASLAT
jgi:hypothetical protein